MHVIKACRRQFAAGGITLAALVVVSGCTSSSAPTVEDVAQQFYQAFSAGDGASACDLLAPKTRQEVEESGGTSCATVLLGKALPDVGTARDATVFGDQAQIRFDGDTTFLAEYPDGWKVVAAGCTPNAELPYDCLVKGS